MAMRILAISGSLRDGSYNTLLLRAAEQQAPADVQIELYDDLAQVPPFHGDRSTIAPVPEPVRDLQERIANADAVLIATPEYNGSIPGVLKNALDWVSTPFPDNVLRGKPVAVERRHLRQVLVEVDLHAGRCLLLRGAEQQGVVRAVAQAA